MTACMVARVGAHSDITGLATYSSVPVINALSSDFHPLQSIADFLTIYEAFAPKSASTGGTDLGLQGLKVAWVGDSNNVLFDLASACVKMGVNVSVAAPKGYGIPAAMREHILAAGKGVAAPGKLSRTTVPEDAVRDADVIVTDTWISMGQEEETQKRLQAFKGFQVTNVMAERGGAKPGWKFMHCLPRHQDEVDDAVFYGPRSLVFPEGENRLWAAVGMLTLSFITDLMANAIMYSGPRGIRREEGQDFVKAKSKQRRSLMKHAETSTFLISKLPQTPQKQALHFGAW